MELKIALKNKSSAFKYRNGPRIKCPILPGIAGLNASYFKLTQHLLQGFGFAPNRRLIRIAQKEREISDVSFRLQITTTGDQFEDMYWDLVYAYENVRVQREQLAFADE